MPIHRYKRVEHVPPPALAPAHPDGLRQAFEWSLAMARLSGRKPTPGVYRRDVRHPPPDE